MSNKIIKTFILLTILFCPLFVFAKTSKIKNFKKTAYSGYQNELLVIGALKNLYAAQADYFSAVGSRRFGNLTQLRDANLIDETLASGVKFGYVFSIQASSSNYNPSFVVSVKPLVYRKTGKRSFYFDARCEIRGADKNGADADVNDALLETCTPTIAYDNEAIVIATMRQLATAQERYRATFGNGNYGTFFQLLDARLMRGDFLNGFNSHYNFSMWTISGIPDINYPTKFYIYANPRTYGALGFRSFYIDKTNVLKGADHAGRDANKGDPEIVD